MNSYQVGIGRVYGVDTVADSLILLVMGGDQQQIRTFFLGAIDGLSGLYP